MANYVQLGAGLRELGNIAGNVSDFMQRERQLDQGDERIRQQDEQLALLKEEQQHRLRKEKNEAYGRELMGAINEANQATKADGSKYQNFGEYLDSDAGNIARDRLTAALADSNSQFRAQLKGAPVRSVRNQDGRFTVEKREGESWVPVQNPDGTAVTFNGTELAQKARLDAASAGIAEIIYFKRDAQRQLRQGTLTQEQFDTLDAQLSDQAGQILDAGDAAGIPREVIVQTSAQGDPANWPKETEEPEDDSWRNSRLGNAISQAAPVLGSDLPLGTRGPIAAGAFLSELINPSNPKAGPGLRDLGASARAVVTDAAETVGNQVRAVRNPYGPTGPSGPATPAEQQPGAKPPAPPPPAELAPLGADADKVVAPTPRNTTPAAQQARLSRAVSYMERPILNPAEGRDAALQYANAMTIMGRAPDSQILANLYSGDTMRGDAAIAAANELKFMQAAAKKGQTATQNFTNQLKLRDQIHQEREAAAEAAATSAIPPGTPNRAEAVGQLKGLINIGMSTHNNDLKLAGFDTTQLMSSVASLPVVADLLAKHYVADMSAARHNANGGWFSTKKERTTIMNRVLKEVSVMDPAGFRRQIYLGLVASRPSDMAADDPKLIEAARKTIQYYEKMETPDNAYDIPQ